MKKLLFAALLATVAVGGAMTTVNAETLYPSGGGPTSAFNCTDGGLTNCLDQFPGQSVYSQPAAPNGIQNSTTDRTAIVVDYQYNL